MASAVKKMAKFFKIGHGMVNLVTLGYRSTNACGEALEDWASASGLNLTQSLARLSRHTHTPKCNELAKIWANY